MNIKSIINAENGQATKVAVGPQAQVDGDDFMDVLATADDAQDQKDSGLADAMAGMASAASMTKGGQKDGAKAIEKATEKAAEKAVAKDPRLVERKRVPTGEENAAALAAATAADPRLRAVKKAEGTSAEQAVGKPAVAGQAVDARQVDLKQARSNAVRGAGPHAALRSLTDRNPEMDPAVAREIALYQQRNASKGQMSGESDIALQAQREQLQSMAAMRSMQDQRSNPMAVHAQSVHSDPRVEAAIAARLADQSRLAQTGMMQQGQNPASMMPMNQAAQQMQQPTTVLQPIVIQVPMAVPVAVPVLAVESEGPGEGQPAVMQGPMKLTHDLGANSAAPFAPLFQKEIQSMMKDDGNFGKREEHSDGMDLSLYMPQVQTSATRTEFAGMIQGLRSDSVSGTRESVQIRNPEDVAGQVWSLASKGGGAVRMKVQPEHLGELTISVENRGGNIHVNLQASSQEARDILTSRLPELRQALAAQNFEVARLEVTGAQRSDSGLGSTLDQRRGDSQPGSAWDNYLMQREQGRHQDGRRQGGYRYYQQYAMDA